jgi:hypothetical protein
MNVFCNLRAMCKVRRVLFYALLPIHGRGCRLLAVEPCRCRVQTGIQKAHRATPEQDLAVEMQIASLMARIPIVFDHGLRLTTT